MKLCRLFILGLLAVLGNINAQSDFRPGYIIDLAGDTTYGKIDYRTDFMMGSICRFKNETDAIIEYEPNEISAFRFTDSKYYVSKEVNGKYVFLEYLIKGTISIFYLRDAIGDHYYIEKENIRFTEIPYEEGEKYIDKKRVYYESTRHIGFLKYYMQDAPEFNSRINTFKKPEHKNLIKLAEDYHNAVCKDEECVVYEKNIPWIIFDFEPLLGITNYKDIQESSIDISGNINIYAPRTNENLSVRTGIIYQKISIENSNAKMYKIPFLLQYIYPAYNLQPKMGIGFNFITLNSNVYNYFGHTFCLNAGVNYKLSDKFGISTLFLIDTTPITRNFLFEEEKLSILSYSMNFGLYFRY